jgi:regulator of sirC expression with transglutaminase-like and TPR domain
MGTSWRAGIAGTILSVPIEPFATLAAAPEARIDLLALALAAEFREVDADAALARLDELGEEVAVVRAQLDGPDAGLVALREVLAVRHDFQGDRNTYDDPDNSMLDLVIERRRGLPIVLSVLYVAAAQRAGIALGGVGLPGHYVVRDLATVPPVVIDPFAGGTRLEVAPSANLAPWTAHETALRMLNNLVRAYLRRNDLARTIRAAEMRLALPSDATRTRVLRLEWLSLLARLN